ncbi:flagellar export protein FliJ, partial [Ramlibacter alkalitolerans]
MIQALPLLIETAEGERDHRAAVLGRAREAHAQAQATLQRLLEFRADCLARSATGRLGRGDGGTLETYQVFVGLLDEAIRLQEGQAAQGLREAEAQLRLLQAAQQRLAALQTLLARDAHARPARGPLREQHAADEFAALAFLRAAQENPV